VHAARNGPCGPALRAALMACAWASSCPRARSCQLLSRLEVEALQTIAWPLACAESGAVTGRPVAASTVVSRRAVVLMLVCDRGPNLVATVDGRVMGAARRGSWLVVARRTSSLPPTPGVGPGGAS
jgi:hypothetical protein